MIFFPFFGGLIAAATAFLQVEAKWWCGLLFSFAALMLGLIAVVFIENAAPGSPALGIPAALILASILIGFGSVLALVLRRRMSRERSFIITFIAAFVFFFGFQIVV